MKTIKIIIIVLLGSLIKISQAQNIDTLKIYYGIDVSELNSFQKTKIDSLIKKTKQLQNLKISINGYTDYLAGNEYNKILSCKRADNIKNYLIDKGIPKNNIQSKGHGKLPPELKNNPDGIQENRKVEIIVNYLSKTNAKPLKTKVTEEISEENQETTETNVDYQKNFNLESNNNKESKNIDTKINNKDTNGIKLTDLEVGKNIILKNVNFYPGRHFPMEEARPALENLFQVMKDNPTLEIEIQGHICCVPFEHDCYDYDTKRDNLSKERAKYVYNYLIRNGIDKSRLRHKGYGAKYKLRKPEITEIDRMTNRRVEIKILKK